MANRPEMINVPLSEWGDQMSINLTALSQIKSGNKKTVTLEIPADLIYEGQNGVQYLNLSIQPSDQDFAKASIKPQWSKEARDKIKEAVAAGKLQWSDVTPFVGNVKRSKFEQENAASSPAPASNFATVESEESEDLPF